VQPLWRLRFVSLKAPVRHHSVFLKLTETGAQAAVLEPTFYRDPKTLIEFGTFTFETETTSPYTFGIALPEDALEKNATEYIGLIVSRRPYDNDRQMNVLSGLTSIFFCVERNHH
jgi:hypothetical protein